LLGFKSGRDTVENSFFRLWFGGCMTAREQLIQEIRQAPDSLVEELLKVLISLKNRQPDLAAAPNQDSVDKRPTVLERMGGLPRHLLSAGDLSDRDRRRAILQSRIQRSDRYSG
jgi:hypothetical protein